MLLHTLDKCEVSEPLVCAQQQLTLQMYCSSSVGRKEAFQALIRSLQRSMIAVRIHSANNTLTISLCVSVCESVRG